MKRGREKKMLVSKRLSISVLPFSFPVVAIVLSSITMAGEEDPSLVPSSPSSVVLQTNRSSPVREEHRRGATCAVATEATSSAHSEKDRSSDADSTFTDPTSTSATSPKWSVVLSTPATRSSYSPATDLASLKANLHGLGLKYAIDRTKVLSRTGQNCAALLFDISKLYDELASALFADKDKRREGPVETLEQATQGTPLAAFAADVAVRVTSFAHQIQVLGTSLRTDVARPYQDNAAALVKEGARHYAGYVTARQRCASCRREALRRRRRYLEGLRDMDGAIAGLRKARKQKAGRRRSAEVASDSGTGGGDGNTNNNACGNGEGVETVLTSDPLTYWKTELRNFGAQHFLSGKCETVIKISEAAEEAQTKYLHGVAEENKAVEEVQAVERSSLESVQCLEEVRDRR